MFRRYTLNIMSFLYEVYIYIHKQNRRFQWHSKGIKFQIFKLPFVN